MSVTSLSSASTSKHGRSAPTNESMAMVRTQSKIMRTSMAPIAVGRSGHRLEKGISASGLLGERLQPGSFIQRSWLPYDDPALLYKVHGKPEAVMPEGVALNIGNNPENIAVGWHHGRKGVPFPPGIFMDT